ncbi:small ubiquitin-related modifier-like [Metopolophium dirhodum]|uniref:small ubiquitin-related modifier-like n=1 Tax=Metopolophium dirhodum TaxID=44670 RepID=UPI0029903213|nr:small ubiquitin-related modifier-like [Metopolophium dirhodum]
MASALPSTSANGGSPKSEKPNKETDDKVDPYIRIRVITSDRSNEVHFRLKLYVSMSRMKRAYAQKLGQNADELRFVFDGHRITDFDTPKSLGMVDDDVVEIYQERTGGGM